MRTVKFCRYRIEGILKTLQPLRIGTGLEDPDRIPPSKEKNVQVTMVTKDCDGFPYIPATTLKGRLHQWADMSGLPKPLVRSLFGFQKKKEGLGGKLIVHDACCLAPIEEIRPPLLFDNIAEGRKSPLHWDSGHWTYVMASTVLNRFTRTAQENKLYHFEVVPKGTNFKVVIDGEGLTEEELGLLLVSLDQFKEDDGLTLGGLSAHGYGKMKWKALKYSGLRTEEEIKSWLDGSSCGFEGFPEIDKVQLNSNKNLVSESLTQGSSTLTLDLEIQFEGPFIINDPSQCIKRNQDDHETPDHNYLRNTDGNVVLTGKTLHGALRAQAERIVRTVFHDNNNPLNKACYIDSRDQACPPLFDANKKRKTICLTCQLFGGNGWRSPITISDFTPVQGKTGEDFTQEFVAIDRFTGGAADEKKFNACYRYGPTFGGELKIDLNRIDGKLAGLLIFALRDLIEGDISLGYGRSKGFGYCQAKITKVILPDIFPGWTDQCLKDWCEDRTELDKLPMNDNQTLPMQELVDTFLREV